MAFTARAGFLRPPPLCWDIKRRTAERFCRAPERTGPLFYSPEDAEDSSGAEDAAEDACEEASPDEEAVLPALDEAAVLETGWKASLKMEG